MLQVDNSYIGAMCAEFRRYQTDCTQADVANDVGVRREQVTRFERGIRGDSRIFLWYIHQGIFEYKPIEKWQGWGGAF